MFAVLAVGLRGVIHWRQTGQNPIRSGSRGMTGPQALLGLAVLLAAGPVLDLTGVLEGADLGAWSVVGLVVMAAGIAGTLWAQFAMGTSWRIGLDPTERTELVTSGPFAVVRNPIFSSMLLLAAGQALAVPNLVTVLAVAVLLGMLEFHVRAAEEPYLLSVHGDAYRRYTERVGRFVPRIRREPASRS